MLLSVIGGVLGFLLARLSLDMSLRLLADHLPPFAEITIDTRVLAFTILLSVIAGVLAGLIPSLRFSRVDVNEGLKLGQSRGSSEAGGGKTRNVLVVAWTGMRGECRWPCR